jgi:hypothetical protein
MSALMGELHCLACVYDLPSNQCQRFSGLLLAMIIRQKYRVKKWHLKLPSYIKLSLR